MCRHSAVSRGKRLCFLALSFVPALALCELALALIFPDFRAITEQSAELGYQLRPNVHMHDYSTLLRDYRVVDYETDDHHRRGPASSCETDCPRVFCFGDSNTFGQGVEYDETYPWLLGRRLSAQIANFGVPGHNGAQVIDYSRSVLEREKPDLMVLQFCGNDDDVRIPFDQAHKHRLLCKTRVGALSYLLYRHAQSPKKNAKVSAGKALRKFLPWLKDRKIPTVLLFSSKPRSLAQIDLRQEFAGEQVAVIEYDDLHTPETMVRSSNHLNGRGNEIVAQRIAFAVEQHRWIAK